MEEEIAALEAEVAALTQRADAAEAALAAAEADNEQLIAALEAAGVDVPAPSTPPAPAAEVKA